VLYQLSIHLSWGVYERSLLFTVCTRYYIPFKLSFASKGPQEESKKKRKSVEAVGEWLPILFSLALSAPRTSVSFLLPAFLGKEQGLLEWHEQIACVSPLWGDKQTNWYII